LKTVNADKGERKYSAAIHGGFPKSSKQQGLHKRGWGRTTQSGGKSKRSL